MGADSSATDDSHQTLESIQDTLETDSIAFVDTLNADISSLLENHPGLEYEYILGDVSGYGISGNGHAHFDLEHGGSTIHCVIFKNWLARLDVEIEDGEQVAVKGDLSYYEANGSTSVIVTRVVPIGEGEYEQIYRKNRKILENDGLLDDDTKQPLPELPQRVGVVTSADSDARTDVVTSLHGRHPDVDIVIQHSSVQGMDAMASLMEAIDTLDRAGGVDVIIVTRGGGSDTDLRVFNETPLCRLIAGTTTPIVVGVGHENDRTLADEVADERVMTPTHAGEIVPEKATLEEAHTELGTRLEAAYGRHVESTLESHEDALTDAYRDLVERRVDRFAVDLEYAYQQTVQTQYQTLETRLEHAYNQFQQQKAHEAAQEEAQAEYERSKRRQRIAIAVLLVVLALLLGYILL